MNACIWIELPPPSGHPSQPPLRRRRRCHAGRKLPTPSRRKPQATTYESASRLRARCLSIRHRRLCGSTPVGHRCHFLSPRPPPSLIRPPAAYVACPPEHSALSPARLHAR
uniref:Uncharacterized protein n=1 Tax=Oryza sativa subsp. japonica TaxID=39947 RepID=Q6Z2B9_ORYSJ|nr:hypothetical protein [Oryza sativa Japonica Group]